LLEVITGCMYSGKSEELIRRLRRCQIAGQRTLLFKSSLDARYASADVIATHPGGGGSGGSLFLGGAHPVQDSEGVRKILLGAYLPEVIALDEAQFMDPGIVPLLERRANLGVRVMVAGLDLDFQGQPFGAMAELLARADRIDKLTAVCVAPTPNGGRCGEPATRSFRFPEVDSGSLVQVGSAGMYEARCRACWHRGISGT
jgi:thymidine kinase